MAYRTLLAHFPLEEGADAVLAASAGLAERHGAHLIGLHVVPLIDLPYAYEVPLVMSAEFQAEQKRRTRRLQERFEKGTGGGSFVAEWRVLEPREPSNDRTLIEQANTVDLVIVGQSSEAGRRGGRGTPESRLLLGCGRPVLVVAPEHGCASVGERVFVAWDGQRASTRALFAALPMLSGAQAVRLQRMNTPARDRHHALGSTEEVADTLSRHGVKVEVYHADAREGEIGEELLGYAADWGADVIVGGCHEQGGLREFLFGSTTRRLLQHAPVPLLMSS